MFCFKKDLVLIPPVSFDSKKKARKSSRPEVLCEKGVLENFAMFTGEYLCLESLFDKEIPKQMFYREYSKIFKKSFFIEHLRFFIEHLATVLMSSSNGYYEVILSEVHLRHCQIYVVTELVLNCFAAELVSIVFLL